MVNILQKGKNYLLSPLFIAFIPALIISLVIPEYFPKYTSTLVKHSYNPNENIKTSISDLNNDGTSEIINTNLYTNGQSSITVRNQANSIINEWLFPGKTLDFLNPIMIGDYDHNGFQEIYTFFYSNDSLFIGYFEPLLNPDGISNQKYFSLIKPDNGRIHVIINPGQVTDLNSDGYGEIIFLTVAGFNKQPRRLFAWDRKKNKILESPLSGIQLYSPLMTDLNGDGNPEILLNSYAPGNCKKDEFPYSDSSAWICALNNKLEFLFTPIEFKGRVGSINMVPLIINGKKYMVVLYSKTLKTKNERTLLLIDISGKIIRRRDFILNYNENINLYNLPGDSQTRFILYNNSKKGISLLNDKLDTAESYNVDLEGIGYMQWFDADRDGKQELILIDKLNKELCILRDNLITSTRLKISVDAEIPKMYNYLNGHSAPTLFIQDGRHTYEYLYQINKLYYLKFPFYGVIFLLSSMFIWGIQVLGRIQIQRRMRLERKICELQTLAIQGQLSPHFTLNAMNSIGSVILQNRADEAYDYMTSFSGLIRSSLVTAHTISRTLVEELDFVKNYLRLEQLRLNYKFSYTIDIHDDINLNISIPKMLIQIFVENAIKHGLSPKEKDGLLKISIILNTKTFDSFRTVSKPNSIIISIEDNGIGRKSASQQSSGSTGMGLSVMSQLIEILNRNNPNRISFTIADLFDGQNNIPIGTKVTISLLIDDSME